MYQFERNSRIYMKGGEADPENRKSSSTAHLNSNSRPSSKSPLQELNKSTNSLSHHRSNQNLNNGHNSCAQNGTMTASNPTRHHTQTKSLKDSQQRAVSSELGDLTAPGETRTKTQMARAFQESQELYKSADSKAGLQTVKTRRVLKKTTTITRGENEKVSSVANLF